MKWPMNKIIITDDHPMMAESLARSLEADPRYEVIQLAHSFDELWEGLKGKPDILILDINLNGVNAVEYIHQIKSLYPSLKILIFSSYNMPSLVKKAFDKGVDGYILKDTDSQGLLDALQAILQGETFVGKGVAMGRAKKKRRYKLEDDFIKKAKLSRREAQVMALIAEGKDNQSIAGELFISKHTVQSHRKSLFKKLGVHSAKELIKLVHGL